MAAGQQPVVVLGTIGSIDKFDPSDGELFSHWYARFNMFCATNGIAPEDEPDENGHVPATRRRTLFLASLGKRAYRIIHMAASPTPPESYALAELVAVLKQQYESPSFVEANRLIFRQRMQRTDESVFEYVSVLQELGVSCNFGDAYDDSLKSQMILGIRHVDTKNKTMPK